MYQESQSSAKACKSIVPRTPNSARSRFITPSFSHVHASQIRSTHHSHVDEGVEGFVLLLIANSRATALLHLLLTGAQSHNLAKAICALRATEQATLSHHTNCAAAAAQTTNQPNKGHPPKYSPPAASPPQTPLFLPQTTNTHTQHLPTLLAPTPSALPQPALSSHHGTATSRRHTSCA